MLTTAASPPPVRQRRRALLVATALMLLVVVEISYRKLAEAVPATGSAAWIWSDDDPQQAQPRAFYLLRDFELGAVPAQAQLSVLADEEYLLYLNGERVGSNVYSPGAPLDRYDVESLLRPGGNRLLAEVRSRQGSGGFLLRLLVDGDERVVSDGDWRVVRRYDPGLFGGWLSAAVGEPVKVWGQPPTGRWGRPEPAAARPLFEQGAPEVAGLRGAALQWTEVPQAFRSPLEGERWPHVWLLPQGAEGYLEVEFAHSAPSAALLYLRADLPGAGAIDVLSALSASDPAAAQPADGGRRADATAPQASEVAAFPAQMLDPSDFMLSPAGAPYWSSAQARRLRLVAVIAAEPPVAVRVLPAAASLVSGAGRAEVAGLLGIDPPPRPSPIFDEILRSIRTPPAAAPEPESP
jgi:hypothetical protein